MPLACKLPFDLCIENGANRQGKYVKFNGITTVKNIEASMTVNSFPDHCVFSLQDGMNIVRREGRTATVNLWSLE